MSNVLCSSARSTSNAEIVPLRQATSRSFGVQNSRDFGNIVSGVFTPVLAKHTKSFRFVDTLSVGVDRIQRNSEPIQRQVESWRQAQITDAHAKLIFYSACVDGKLDAPKSLLSEVHRRTSSRSIRSSRHERCGACRTRSRAPSRSLIRFRSQSDGQAGRLSRTTAQLIRDLRCALLRAEITVHFLPRYHRGIHTLIPNASLRRWNGGLPA